MHEVPHTSKSSLVRIEWSTVIYRASLSGTRQRVKGPPWYLVRSVSGSIKCIITAQTDTGGKCPEQRYIVFNELGFWQAECLWSSTCPGEFSLLPPGDSNCPGVRRALPMSSPPIWRHHSAQSFNSSEPAICEIFKWFKPRWGLINGDGGRILSSEALR